MSRLSLKQIRYFHAVASTGSFTAAAKVLDLTQPALGFQIRGLEAELGVELLTRSAKGVRLTNAGSTLFKHTESIIRALEAAEYSVRERPSVAPEEFVLGVTPTLGQALLETFTGSEFSKAIPFRLTLVEALSDELYQMLERGDLHGAFCYDPEPVRDCEIHPMYEEDLVVVGRPDTVCQSSISLQDLTIYPLALGTRFSCSRRAIMAASRLAGVTLDIRAEVDLISLKRDILIRGGLCAIVPQGLYLSEVKSGTLGAARIEPAIRQLMTLILHRKVPQQVQRRILDAAIRDIEREINKGALGWRSPSLAATTALNYRWVAG